MNEKTLRVLEYPKIMELLRDQAVSPMAKARIGSLRPSRDAQEVRGWMAETTEAVSVILHKGALPLGSFYDVDAAVHLAMKGGTLTMKQLLEVLYDLQVARNAVRFLESDLPELPIIQGLAEVLRVHRRLEEEIDRSILSEDEMADSASPELRSIRRKIALQNEAVRNRMNSILSSADNRALLQDAIVTLRQGRYVIPVKQEHKNRFPGIIHDQSSTGATLFIEPQVIVDMNNALRELELAERREMERILAQLSADVAGVGEEIRNNQRILIELDLLFAKGKLSAAMRGEAPEIGGDGPLRIRNGRHPLLDPKKVVPITVSLGEGFRTLVITGPNTGGKTVTLKTVGLFVLMAQTGLHLPAGSGTRIPVMQKVYADIGDEQSIEQSLSTFSSHMSNIVEIVREADDRTLVLLDELGAGTDPTEGAALAIAILDDLYRRGSHTMATTHYTELKKYAIATEGVQNASMEFDVETLSPTYRLTVGTPGRSNAFEISAKLGLPPVLIEAARGLLEREDIAFEDVISAIDRDRREAERERDEALALRLAMQADKDKLDERERRFEQKRDELLAKAREEAKDTIREVKEFADRVQQELRALEKMTDPAERHRAEEALRQQVRDRQAAYADRIEPKANPEPVRADELALGDLVRILSLDQVGEVVALPDEKRELTVQVGLMKVNVALEQVTRLRGKEKKQATRASRYGSLYQSKSSAVLPSCNVVGQNLDDALMEVDKYLDDAFMAGLREVTVIHGRGAGILRDGLADMFRRHKHVTGFRKGQYNEGGDGVTIVSLK